VITLNNFEIKNPFKESIIGCIYCQFWTHKCIGKSQCHRHIFWRTGLNRYQYLRRKRFGITQYGYFGEKVCPVYTDV
jgi:hypothetical protein